jgi:hypothetical protein
MEKREDIKTWIASVKSWSHALTLTYPAPKAYGLSLVSQRRPTTNQSMKFKNHKTTNSYPDYTKSFDWSKTSVPRHLKLIHAFVDKKLFGCRFNLLAPEKRSFFFAFISGDGETRMLHTHMIWSVCAERQEKFEALFSDKNKKTLWNKLVPSGTHKIEKLYDADGWETYCKKQSRWEETVISSVFMPFN